MLKFIQQNNLRVTYEPNEWDDFDSILIHDDNNPESEPMTLDDYLEKIDKTQHEFIRQILANFFQPYQVHLTVLNLVLIFQNNLYIFCLNLCFFQSGHF